MFVWLQLYPHREQGNCSNLTSVVKTMYYLYVYLKITLVLPMLCRRAIVKVGLRRDYIFSIQGTAEKKHGDYHSKDKIIIRALNQPME